MSRMVVLDTETTGIGPEKGHRIIEIGCIEIVNRKLTGNHYHTYINPERPVDEGAFAVHGLSNSFLADKPVFSQIAIAFHEFIRGAELIIHNAPFDTGFINHEFRALANIRLDNVETYCQITDSLQLARKKHIGQKNSLDALCKRYGIDNSSRSLHGALLDAELLAEVYLKMTGGQTSLILGEEKETVETMQQSASDSPALCQPLPVIKASEDEFTAHKNKLAEIAKISGKASLWEELQQ